MEIKNLGREMLIDIGKTIIPNFEISNENIQNYQKLYYYFLKNEEKCNELGIDVNKGLWVYGEVGSGKSIAFKVFQEFCFYTQKIDNRRFSIYRYKKFEDEYDEIKSKVFEIYGYGGKKDICFDEFMKTVGIVNDFGIKKNLVELILEDRYDLYINEGFKTHITTNVAPTKILADGLLDQRTLDRCTQMFNIIEWKGGTKRI